jgi:ribosome-binding protein aMBF1 (putative translation factor)
MTEASQGNFYDKRALTPQELALIVVDQRESRGWTQATLAELSGITERTIQRIEGGEPSSVGHAARSCKSI